MGCIILKFRKNIKRSAAAFLRSYFGLSLTILRTILSSSHRVLPLKPVSRTMIAADVSSPIVPLECSHGNNDNNSLSPINNDVCLDKKQFTRILPMLVVGLVCNREIGRLCEKLRPCFTSYVGIPKLSRTYHDADGKLRKLMFIQPDSIRPDSEPFQTLTSLDVNLTVDPCPLEPDSSDPSTSTVTGKGSVELPLDLSELNTITGPGSVHVSMGYANYSFRSACKILLPDHVQPSTAFTVMGHVAHFNLKLDALPYRHLIGQVILDKFPNVRTVIHKAASIESDYQTFELDLMAGVADYVTAVQENGLTFELDVSKVYWNSRLSTEHGRIVEKLRRAQTSVDKDASDAESVTTVYDVFAGVGPFAIPAAQVGCRVLANDLNPESYKWLVHNVKKNQSGKHPLENIFCYNLDGRKFIREIVLPDYWKALQSTDRKHSRFVVVMNLPSLALDFLDGFLHFDGDTPPNGSVDSSHPSHPRVPLEVHCYCFLRRHVECESIVLERIHRALNSKEPIALGPIHLEDLRWHFVRTVAPFKDLLRVEFQL